MVTPIEITALPTYTRIAISSTYVLGNNLVETATALSNRKGVTFRNVGPSEVYITNSAGNSTGYITLPVGDSVVYIMSAVASSLTFYFAVPASGSATIEREEWL